MLMDLFHSTLPPQFNHSRRRIHFHQFMLECHKRNHAYKLKYGEHGDRLGEVARDLAREARVLSFDEFQVGRSVTFHEGPVAHPRGNKLRLPI